MWKAPTKGPFLWRGFEHVSTIPPDFGVNMFQKKTDFGVDDEIL
jgi:hypothetical protein